MYYTHLGWKISQAPYLAMNTKYWVLKFGWFSNVQQSSARKNETPTPDLCWLLILRKLQLQSKKFIADLRKRETKQTDQTNLQIFLPKQLVMIRNNTSNPYLNDYKWLQIWIRTRLYLFLEVSNPWDYPSHHPCLEGFSIDQVFLGCLHLWNPPFEYMGQDVGCMGGCSFSAWNPIFPRPEVMLLRLLLAGLALLGVVYFLKAGFLGEWLVWGRGRETTDVYFCFSCSFYIIHCMYMYNIS